MKSILLITYHLFVLLSLISCWDLLPLGISENFRLLHVSLHYIRAFLCIENLPNSTTPTLLESTWPENLLVIKPKVFPSMDAHSRNFTDCSRIIKARFTNIDNAGRLWMLDVGNEFCKPKLIIYDLIKINKELFRVECRGFRGDEVLSMQIDPEPILGQYTAYFTLKHGRYIAIFHLKSRKWWKLLITEGTTMNTRTIQPYEIAFTLDHKLYISDKFGNLFVADTHTSNGAELRATALGTLLGQPKGLITDLSGSLYYILPKHGAVVRWQPRRNLTAEEHEVLFFHSIPLVQILFGVKGSVWVVTETIQTSRDHCYRILYHYGIASDIADFH